MKKSYNTAVGLKLLAFNIALNIRFMDLLLIFRQKIISTIIQHFCRKGNAEETAGMNAELIKVWMLLSEAKIIPEEATAALLLLINIPQNWDKTDAFDLGLDLKAN